jgi:diguanylate cyclase (GGDEF)-like protein
MKEFLNLNHIALMQISFLIMFALTIISFGYSAFGKKSISSKYIVLGNTSYMFFFFIVSVVIGIKIPQIHVVVAFFDMTALILWIMGLNEAISMLKSKKFYIILSIINLILASVLYSIFLKYSVVRSTTSIIIVIILVDTIIRFYKNQKIRDLSTFKFTGYTLILFAMFKFIMTIYRFISMFYEEPIFKMSVFSSVNVLTLISLVFAIWINFAIAFLSYDILNNDVKKLSLIDHLTKLPNRRMIMNKFEEVFKIHERKKNNFAIAIFDLDDFKKVNDNYGHNIGDEVLEEFSDFLKNEIRDIDFVGRYGGEEFILIIQSDKMDQVKVMLNRFLLELNQKIFSSSKIKITISGGVVLVDKYEKFSDTNKIIALADDRLYIAKKNGKNQIAFKS